MSGAKRARSGVPLSERPLALGETRFAVLPPWTKQCPPQLVELLERNPDCYLSFRTTPRAGGSRGGTTGHAADGTAASAPVADGEPPVCVPMQSHFLQLHSATLWAEFELQRESHAQQPTNALPTLPAMDAEELPGWLEVLYLLYHAKPKAMTWTRAALVLPVAHKHGISCLLEECHRWTVENVAALRTDGDVPDLFKWLERADRYDLDGLKAAALDVFRKLPLVNQAYLLREVEDFKHLLKSTVVGVIGIVADAVLRKPDASVHRQIGRPKQLATKLARKTACG